MSPIELEQYLHEHIPLSKAMQVSVLAAEEAAVLLAAPLAPNINHRATVFGGSASAVAILSAWSLLHTRLVRDGVASRLVIQRNTMSYERPIEGRFIARSALAQPQEWANVKRMLMRKRQARLEVATVPEHEGRVAGRFPRQFVASTHDAAPPAISTHED